MLRTKKEKTENIKENLFSRKEEEEKEETKR